MAVYRENPYSRFNYLVALGGGSEPASPQAGFAEVSGLSIEVEVIEYRNGNDPSNVPRKLPGLSKVGDVTLKRGVIGSTDLYEWIRTAVQGSPERRKVTVLLLSEDRERVVQEWHLRNAWPRKYSGPELSATANEVAIEQLVLACEDLEME